MLFEVPGTVVLLRKPRFDDSDVAWCALILSFFPERMVSSMHDLSTEARTTRRVRDSELL